MVKKKKLKPEHKKLLWQVVTAAVIIAMVIGAIVFLYNRGYINPRQQETFIEIPKGNGAGTTAADDLLDDCQEVCESEGYDTSRAKTAIDLFLKCKPDTNEVYVEYGYPNEEPLLKCCCWNEEAAPEDELILGCNDNDFTQTSFDTSIMFPGNCIDDSGQHDDSCDADGLLEEWSCPAGGDAADTCSATYLNCKSYLGNDAICYNGQCVIQECDINIECMYIYGEGYVCRDNMCLEVTAGNCNSIVQDEGYSVGLWIPGGDYIDCNAQCDSYCPSGCSQASTGGTWGDCCGYTCN